MALRREGSWCVLELAVAALLWEQLAGRSPVPRAPSLSVSLALTC